MRYQTAVTSSRTATALADVQATMAHYRVASAEMGAVFAVVLRQSKWALANSRLLLARIERRPQIASTWDWNRPGQRQPSH